ncbi:hypothetical protein CCP4SC76_1660006 [Gammaproteobacteria bacterium]
MARRARLPLLGRAAWAGGSLCMVVRWRVTGDNGTARSRHHLVHCNPMEIVLPLGEASLVLSGNPWCSLSLQVGDAPTNLGADTLSVVVSRLLSNIAVPARKSCGLYQDREMYWVLSLSEHHHTIYTLSGHVFGFCRKQLEIQCHQGFHLRFETGS